MTPLELTIHVFHIFNILQNWNVCYSQWNILVYLMYFFLLVYKITSVILLNKPWWFCSIIKAVLHYGLLTCQEIPPYETKGVMRASFSSREADNHTAFIRIKTNASDSTEFIILPVEVEVTTGQWKTASLFGLFSIHLTLAKWNIIVFFFPSSWNLFLNRNVRFWYTANTR